ncbi:DinB family protein [Mucilaginibacter sp. Bleaf8]|uniref:DinB family protein n=1 Tax=Mucilaginibacter sp. Bleaf8 TaxID=2834430 RepID=UPI001BD11BEE|nr:DinB family protein [Mucilaginibacter sp. Bleaf8]MBS7563275.1 DinB family protein [Mucilaginibacter sp. Bleaf8]
MNKPIEIIRKTREYLLTLVDGLTLEQLNTVPAGFNNNIIWNLGHLVAAQQGVCYRRAGFELRVDEIFFNLYKSDTKPERPVSQAEFEEIKMLFFSTIDQLEADYKENLFSNYEPWTTRYGVVIHNIDEAIGFLPYHEGLHMGYIMALKRVITENK